MKINNRILNSKATIALLGLWMAYTGHVNAQSGELAITAGGATSSLTYDIADGKGTQGTGLNFGLDYTYYFTESFGIAIGAEYQFLNASAKFNSSMGGSYDTVDYEQESFEFRYTMSSVSEKQKVGFVNIPLNFVFRSVESGFYARAGAKVGLPVTSKFSGHYNLSTSGYYEQYEGELYDPLFMGFGDIGRVSAKGDDIDFKPSYILNLEAGLVLPAGKGKFYSGFYVDYGLNNIKGDETHPVEYTVQQSGAGFTYNSVVNSAYVSSIKTFGFGIKLRYSFLNF